MIKGEKYTKFVAAYLMCSVVKSEILTCDVHCPSSSSLSARMPLVDKLGKSVNQAEFTPIF